MSLQNFTLDVETKMIAFFFFLLSVRLAVYPDWPDTSCEAQADLKLKASASSVLELQACTTTPSLSDRIPSEVHIILV